MFSFIGQSEHYGRSRSSNLIISFQRLVITKLSLTSITCNYPRTHSISLYMLETYFHLSKISILGRQYTCILTGFDVFPVLNQLTNELYFTIWIISLSRCPWLGRILQCSGSPGMHFVIPVFLLESPGLIPYSSFLIENFSAFTVDVVNFHRCVWKPRTRMSSWRSFSPTQRTASHSSPWMAKRPPLLSLIRGWPVGGARAC